MTKHLVEIESVAWVVESNKSYFAVDGNYGSADGMVIIDTTNWSEDEWSQVELASDTERAQVALDLTNKKE